MRAGESPVAIAHQTGALREPDTGPIPLHGPARDGGVGSGEPGEGPPGGRGKQ
jgi:hypothetical protein